MQPLTPDAAGSLNDALVLQMLQASVHARTPSPPARLRRCHRDVTRVCRICRPPPLQSSSVASTCESRALPAHCCSWAITYFPFHQRDLRSDKPQEGQVLIGLSNAQYAERAFTALYAETFPNIFGDSRRSGARTTRAPCGAHTSCSRCRVTCDMRRVYRVPLAAASYRYSMHAHTSPVPQLQRPQCAALRRLHVQGERPRHSHTPP